MTIITIRSSWRGKQEPLPDPPDTSSSSSSSSSSSPPSPSSLPLPSELRSSYKGRRSSSHKRGSGALMSQLRRSSRSSSFYAHSFAYAGPQPLDKDGNPLKSCLSTPKLVRSHRKVSFSQVYVREYSRVVGDNPCVCSGPPLSIGWKYNKRGETDIETYEAEKHLKAKASYCQSLSPEEREKLLIEIGEANHSQIMKGSMQASYDNKLRWQSFERLGGEKHYKSIGSRERVLIMKESARRKFERFCKGTSSSQEQQGLWDNAQEVTRRTSQLTASALSRTARISELHRSNTV